MEELSIDLLATAAGIGIVTLAVVQLVGSLWPGDLSGAVKRWLSIVLGIGLGVGAVLAGIAPYDVTTANTAGAVLGWFMVSLNGAWAGLGASALYDTAKFGTSRRTSPPPPVPDPR